MNFLTNFITVFVLVVAIMIFAMSIVSIVSLFASNGEWTHKKLGITAKQLIHFNKMMAIICGGLVLFMFALNMAEVVRAFSGTVKWITLSFTLAMQLFAVGGWGPGENVTGKPKKQALQEEEGTTHSRD